MILMCSQPGLRTTAIMFAPLVSHRNENIHLLKISLMFGAHLSKPANENQRPMRLPEGNLS